MITKIVSGGQTGVDQAALAAATEMGFPIGGWCPKNGKDERGHSILTKYPSLFKETASEDPAERTKLNIEHSDGTIIIVPALPIPDKIKDGTLLTIEHAKSKQKPYLVIPLDTHITDIQTWVEQHHIHVLNIAGPRESTWPGIHQAAFVLLKDYLSQFSKKAKL